MQKTVLALLSLCASTALAEPVTPSAPIAPREPHPRTLHGETIVDDYFWLRDEKNPRTLPYLRAEVAYAERVMAPTKRLQDRLYAEILSHTREEDVSPPYRLGNYQYVSRSHKGQEHAIFCRRALDAIGKPTGAEQVVMDANRLGKGFVDIGPMAVSDDDNLLAYTVDLVGHEDFALRVRDLRTGRDLPEHFVASAGAVGTSGGPVWSSDGSTLFYTVEDNAKRAYRAYRHVLGTPPTADVLVYEERDARFVIALERSADKSLIFFDSSSATQSEVRFVPAGAPTAAPQLIKPRSTDHEYGVDAAHGVLYIRTNLDAPNFRIMTATVDHPADWKPFIAHDPHVFIDAFQPFDGFLVVEERQDAIRHLRVVDLASGAQHRVEIAEQVRDVTLGMNAWFPAKTFRFVYDSPVTPPSYYEYDPRTRARTLIQRDKVPGGFDPNRYEVARVLVPSGGVRVPVSVIQKKGVAHDGSAPLFLTGYGAYGVSFDVDFVESRLSLLDRGVIVVFAHIRGGGDVDRQWHEDGRMMQKQHTFDDFIAVADWLVQNHYTSPSRMAISGGSAGGLLMGAVLNRRPELFRCVVAQVPFVDVVNTMLDESLPLTVGEFEEWGNPKVAEQYKYLRSYCPYENVRATAYPSMLVTSALHDARAPYWEAAKWVAQLRAKKTDRNPILLHIDLESGGHGGPTGRYEQMKDDAYEYAFILTQLGVEPAAARCTRRSLLADAQSCDG